MDTVVDPFLFVIGPIVSLMILAGIAGVYFLWKERHEDRSGQAHKH